VSGSIGDISARGLGLRTGAGWVYRSVDLDVPAGSLAVISGPAGSGKTALLLTLAGRMHAGEGVLRVAGLDAARDGRAVRRRVGLGEFRGVNGLDETLSVGDQVMAELALHGRRWRGAHATASLDRFGLMLDPHLKVRDLAAGERTLLGAALGMIGDPPLLVIDELDEAATPEEAKAVLAGLRRFTDGGITVVAGALDPGSATDADVSLVLGADGAAAGCAAAGDEPRRPAVEPAEVNPHAFA
jgi:ABC-2 type transport system ATP-binding protein